MTLLKRKVPGNIKSCDERDFVESEKSGSDLLKSSYPLFTLHACAPGARILHEEGSKSEMIKRGNKWKSVRAKWERGTKESAIKVQPG